MAKRKYSDISRSIPNACNLTSPEEIERAFANSYQYNNSTFLANASTPGSYISIIPVDGSGAPPRVPMQHSVAWAFTDITGYAPTKTLTTDAAGVPKWVTTGGGGGTATVLSDHGSGIEIVESPTDTFTVSTNFTTASGCGIKQTASVSDTSIAIEADLESADGIEVSAGSGTAKKIKALISHGTGITVTQGSTISVATNLIDGNGINITGAGAQTIAADIEGGDGVIVTQGATISVEADLEGGNGITVTPGNPTTIEAVVEGGYGIAVTDGSTIEIEADIEDGDGISFSGSNPVSISADLTEGDGIEITPGSSITIAANLTNGQGIAIMEGPAITIEADLIEGPGITLEDVGTSIKISATPAYEEGPGIEIDYPGDPELPPTIETNFEYPDDGAIYEEPGDGTTILIDLNVPAILDRLNTEGYSDGVLVLVDGSWTVVEMSPDCDEPDPADDPENTWDAVVPPTTGDDIDDGYYPGSYWKDVMSGILYLCTDNTASAAVWDPLT